jgi:hypothetical protein
MCVEQGIDAKDGLGQLVRDAVKADGQARKQSARKLGVSLRRRG